MVRTRNKRVGDEKLNFQGCEIQFLGVSRQPFTDIFDLKFCVLVIAIEGYRYL